MENGSLINRYPYLSHSKNIIECFSIIGYEEKYLSEIIKDFKNSKVQNYSPSILSSIISCEDFGIIDNDFIISQIFPENPAFILKSKNNLIQEELQSKNIIYSFVVDSPDSSDGENKIFYTCFALIFYETYIYLSFDNTIATKEEYLIPKAFCIISQYSFFGLFYYICLNIRKLLLKNNENSNNKIPLEIIIYNIVNFSYSPLNHTINYSVFKNILDIPPYNLPQLSGYPLIDFNLLKIFNLLPIKLIVEIYIFTIIEQSILFFSSNLEKLNIIMFIFYLLNYPCNNSTYFWHIVSIPKKDLNEENRFVGQIMTSILGVHSEYDESIDTSAFGGYHLIVDIDNKKLIFKNYQLSEDNNDSKQLESLFYYLNDLIDDKEVDSTFLKKYIGRLIRKIETFLKENELEIIKDKSVNFFEKIDRQKIRFIQEYFYNFMINLLLVMYQNINIDISFGNLTIKNNKDFIFIKDGKKIIIKNEEKQFCKLFKSSSKYKLYFDTFLEKCECSESFKIPYLFSEEFINVKFKSNHNKIALKLPYFRIIDNLYISSQKEVIDIELNHFYFQFLDDELKIEFINFEKGSMLNENQSKNCLFIFNRNILQNYIYILKNYFSKEKLNKYFPSIEINEETITHIKLKNIVEQLQNFYGRNNYIDSSNYLIYSSIYIFSILIPLFSYENLLYFIEKLLTCSKRIHFFFRYYINELFQTFYNLYLINNDTNKFPEMKYNNLEMYFYLLFIALKEERILPNEEMILIQKVFESKKVKKRYSFEVKTNNLEIKSNENIQNNEIDLSDNNNFDIYLKYNFDSFQFYKNNEIISLAMKEIKECNITVNKEKNIFNENKNILIKLKIKDKIFSEEIFSPSKIFKIIKNEYEKYKSSFSLENVDIQNIKAILINLIEYSNELKELQMPYDFFINGLYLFDKYIGNNKNVLIE